ncbi:hypothetical protein ARMSODRAFT_1027837 [Armillaria solidipes]|uniref:Uncharacterized protein n=1 Tax=Armillaria solidipes TaxID=1076256 RepID=A0A2H3AJ59_9AGAR|nr:hypothetical protein ARMSODRAFT_1027837 [Armillaria solidipes]
MGDTRLWGVWGMWAEWGRALLALGVVGSGGQANRRMAIILAEFIEPEGPPLMSRRVCSSSLSFGVSGPIFILPSRSTSPTLLDPLSLLSFRVSPPLDNAMAPPRSGNPPVPVVVLVVSCALRGPSHAEMAADKRLAPMSMWMLLGRWDCEFGSVSWPLAGVYGRNQHRQAWGSPGLSLEMSLYASTSFEGLHGWLWGRCRLSGALGAARCARKT